MYRKIKAPELITNKLLTPTLESLVRRLLECMIQLNNFIRECHNNYSSFAKELQRQCTMIQAKVERAGCPLTAIVLGFTTTLLSMASSLERQAAKNVVQLKSIKTEKDETVLIAFIQKLRRLDGKIQKYQQTSMAVAQSEEEYLRKADEFSDIENDTVKYYSVSYYRRKYIKIKQMQSQLQSLLEQLKTDQSDIQFIAREARRLISDLVALQIKKIRDMNRLARLATLKFASIPLSNEQPYPRQGNQELGMPDERIFYQFYVEQLSRIRQNFLTDSLVRQHFFSFLRGLMVLLHEHCQNLAGLQRQNSYSFIQKNRGVIEECLGPKIYEEFVGAYTQVFKYYMLLQKIASKMDKGKIFDELAGKQKANFDEFYRYATHILEKYKNIQQQYFDPQLTARTYTELHAAFRKFNESSNHFCGYFSQQLQGMLQGIVQVLRIAESEYIKQPWPNQVADNEVLKIYEHRHFQVFISPFVTILSDFNFQQSKYVEKFAKVLGQAAQQGIEEDNQEEQESRENRFRRLLGLKQKDKSPTRYVDQFNCALAYGMLLQGKMFVQRSQLKFISLFNKNTFFGKTKIEIPSKDILKIEEEHGAVNYYIVICTPHGKIKFTSFLNNPLNLLRSTYNSANSSTNSTIKTSSPFDTNTVHNYAAEFLRTTGFNCTQPDTFFKELPTHRCTVQLEITLSTLTMAVSYQGETTEDYLMKVIKPQPTKDLMRCELQELSGTAEMKEHFVEIVRAILKLFNIKDNFAAFHKIYTIEFFSSTQSSVMPLNQDQPKTSQFKIHTSKQASAVGTHQNASQILSNIKDQTTIINSKKDLEKSSSQPPPQINLYFFFGIVVLLVLMLVFV